MIAAIALLGVAGYVYYTYDPGMLSLFPRCPFVMATGYECPGCGSQRAIHSLLHLDIKAAFGYNALMLLAIPYLLLGIYLQFFNGRARHPRLERLFFGRHSAVIVLIIILVYWIGRNIF